VRPYVRAGLPADPVPGGLRNDPVQGPTIGNSLPPNTGVWYPEHAQPGPGYGAGGQMPGNDGYMGADPRMPRRSPVPVFLPGDATAGMDSGTANNPDGWRGGLQGFNDQLQVKDHHAYWDTGHQKTGIESTPYSTPYTYSHPSEVPPTPELRVISRVVNPQIGSDNSAAQDDLTRNYSRNPQGMYLGEQGSGWTPVSGGTPGLYQPYGTRGGVPYPIQAPVGEGEPGDGPHLVFSGPPHGLHSPTLPDGAQTLSRTYVTPQMRPVRFDRPSNSPQAGQSYSQTLPQQGQSGTVPRQAQHSPRFGQGFGTGRGWAGVPK